MSDSINTLNTAGSDSTNTFNPDDMIAHLESQHIDSIANNQIPTDHEAFNPDEMIKQLQEEKYGSGVEQAKTFGEGLLSGVITSPGAAVLETKVFGAKPEDILNRREANPWTHGVGEGAGLVGSSMAGVGEGALLSKIGESANMLTKAGEVANAAVHAGESATAAVKALPLINRVGSAAVTQAAEMAALSAGDEVSKMILQDPSTTAETAIANIGLGTALGGAGGAFLTGVVSPLWSTTVKEPLERSLRGLTEKFGGIEGSESGGALNDAVKRSGMVLQPEIAAVAEGKPGALAAHEVLSQSDTKMAGRAYQKSLDDTYRQANDKLAETVGMSMDEINNLPKYDKLKAGRDMAESLEKQITREQGPMIDQYEKFDKAFETANISPEIKASTADNLLLNSMDKGWHKSASDENLKLTMKAVDDLQRQDNALDLKKYITNLRKDYPYGSEGYEAAKDIRGILMDTQSDIIENAVKESGGSSTQNKIVQDSYGQLRGQYKDFMENLESLNDHLKLGKFDGPKDFLMKLEDMATSSGESLVNKLSGANKSHILEVLSAKYPETLALVKKFHVEDLARDAVSRARPGTDMSPKQFIKNFNESSPQIQQLLVPAEKHDQIQAISEVLNSLEDTKHNHSNTARVIDKLTEGAPSALSWVASFMGHAPAAVAGHLASLGFGEGKAAIKLGMLKFMGSQQAVEGTAFKQMTQMMDSAIKGELAVQKGVKAVLGTGSQVLTKDMLPSKQDRERLDKKVGQFQDNPQLMEQMVTGSRVGHYMPDHQASLTKTSTQAISYLQNLKNQLTPQKSGPMDKPQEPTAAAQARYDRALDIANSPIVVLNHIKEGTLQGTDVVDLKSMYPGYYTMLANRLTNQMVSSVDNEEVVPYKTKVGLSLFLGQPMDSSMSPMSIMAAQPKPEQPPQQGNLPSKKTKGSAPLSKASKSYMTPLQSSEADRSSRD